MSRYRGPRLKIIRRLGSLASFTQKSSRKNKTPGEHGKPIPDGNKNKRRRGKERSQYLVRLEEKQKVRYNYGITDSQLLKYIRQARKRQTSTGVVLFQLLEMRLDNIVVRLGMAPTIMASRQLISHGHLLVNTKKVNIPNYQCQPKDIISVANKKQSQTLVRNFSSSLPQKKVFVPNHLTLNKTELVGVVQRSVDVNSAQIHFDKRLIVEFYSRKI